MKALRYVVCVLAVALSVTDVHASCYVALYQLVTTEWWDGTITRHYEFAGWAETACSSGTTDYGTAGPPAGGPAAGSDIISTLIDNVRDQYAQYGCETPEFDLFVTRAMYDGAEPATNFPFSTLAGGNVVAIISDELRFGLDEMVNRLDGRVPVVTRTFQTPSQNAQQSGSASCGAHTYGRAADLSIRDPLNGDQLSCTMWNMYVEASDHWVEPWQMMIDRGSVPHFHVDFSRPKNDPGTCSGYP